MASSSSSLSSAKYPYPSEINITDIVSIKLSTGNYDMWRPMMFSLIEAQGLLGFIDGKVPIPPKWTILSSKNGATEEANLDYKAWRRSNELLRGWILGTLEQNLHRHVVSFKTAEDMWTIMERCFSAEPFLPLRTQSKFERCFRVPLGSEDFAHHHSGGDIENLTQSLISVPQMMKNIRDQKIMHHQALQLVRYICKEVSTLNLSKASLLYKQALHRATRHGIREIVEEILDSFPSAIYIANELNQPVLYSAIVYRQENIFNLIYQFQEELRDGFFTRIDQSWNTGLHLAGSLENEQALNLRSNAAGAAFQMQRELQWYKEVEKHSLPQAKEKLNNKGKTPAMLFTETHEKLVEEGEKWMKDTANSCTIVAALIVTVVFAAAITVPGGNDSGNGCPILSKERAFVFFGISNALALFSSASSVPMFLSILTSRFGEYNFLYALPKRLIIGLVALFLSIISMMVAFGATLFLVFGDKKAWILVPVAALSSIPVGLFASLQFPLLLDMIKSTQGPGIFGKQSDRLFY